jgi:hypothetical protein
LKPFLNKPNLTLSGTSPNNGYILDEFEKKFNSYIEIKKQYRYNGQQGDV